MDIAQRIIEIEEEIKKTPYHKGTEHHIGLLRARLARLGDELAARVGKKGGGEGFAIKKVGDATMVLVGPPSVGKSTLLNALTRAHSPVAAYEFTTVSVIPGMLTHRGAKIQILDLPGLIEGASRGRGRGKKVLSVVRGADLLLLVTEAGKEESFVQMEEELYTAGVRLNKKPPAVRIEKKTRGGIIIHQAVGQTLTDEMIKEIAQEFGLRNVEISLKEEITIERLIDAFAKNRVFVPTLYVVNKVDMRETTHTRSDLVLVSAKTGVGLEKLKEVIWDELEFVRVYLAKPGQKPDYDSPIIMREGETLLEVARKVGEDFARKVTGVKISGPGSKFSEQKVSFTYAVQDGMVVTFL